MGFNKFEPWCGRQLILSNEGIYISFDKSFAKDNLGVDASIRFNDNRNNEIIFYTRDGQLFRPMCVKTPYVDVVDQTNNCYKDIPVRFANNSKRGFLLSNDIITDSSRIVE